MSDKSAIFDTINWVCSTLPQVLGAMSGLLITGVLFLYNNLTDRVQKDETQLDIVQGIKQILHDTLKRTIIITGIAIILDILSLSFSDKLSEIISIAEYTENSIILFLLFVLIGSVNTVSLYLTLSVSIQILNPDFEVKVIQQLTNKITEVHGDVNAPSGNNEHDKGEKAVILDRVKKTFIQNYQECENLVNEIMIKLGYPSSVSVRNSIPILVREHILSQTSAGILEEATKLRNLIVHGARINRLPVDITHGIIGVVKKLKGTALKL